MQNRIRLTAFLTNPSRQDKKASQKIWETTRKNRREQGFHSCDDYCVFPIKAMNQGYFRKGFPDFVEIRKSFRICGLYRNPKEVIKKDKITFFKILIIVFSNNSKKPFSLNKRQNFRKK